MSCTTAAQMTEERNKLWHQAKAVLNKADAEKRNLNTEERSEYDKLEKDIDNYAEQIATLERKERAAEIERGMTESRGRKTGPSEPHKFRQGDTTQAFKSWVTRPAAESISPDDINNMRDCGISPESRQFKISLRKSGVEQRAMSIGAPTAGGSLVTWHTMADLLDKALRAYGSVLGLVRQIPTGNGIALPIPTSDDTNNKAVIVTEAAAISQTPDPTTGSVILNAYMYSTRAILVSLQLMQDSVVDVGPFVADLLGERLARAYNEHITIGTGAGQPFGIFPRATASGTVVAGTVAAPSFSGDNFIDLMHSVDPAYRNAPGVGFMLHDTIVQRVRKLKDNNGQYLWQPSLQLGQPDRLLAYPLYVNQDAPILAVNARIAAFGDYSRYIWRPVSDLTMYRLDELFLMTGQIGFMGLARADGNLINVNAVKTLSAPAT
jgi:HK97 family phage major capsid protein